jgi:hypothetical protein
MKTLNLGLTCLFISLLFVVNAQQKTALHSNGVTTIFSGPAQFTNAYNAAADGDTIYLPGGTFNSFPTINKRLAIYGAGFHPDSVAVTGATVINGNLILQNDADSCFIQGIDVNGNISTTSNHKVDGFTLSRCRFNSLTFDGNFSSPCNNVIVKECIIGGNVALNNLSYSDITNNLIQGIVSNGEYNAVQNNIFFHESPYNYYYTISNCDNSLFANNVFLRTTQVTSIWGSTEFSTFSNNVFTGTPNVGSNNFNANYYNVDMSTFFVNQSGFTPSFYDDYNLIDPATYLGIDGSEVGIFGGLYPFKAGTLPENPHFQTKTIAPQTDVNGDLNIQIQVGAQDE